MKFVKIPGKDFEMQTTPATQKQWISVMGENPSRFKGDNLPVETVSFYDIEKFLNKLNDSQMEFDYCLPTEDEWAYAALGGEKDIPLDKFQDYAWFCENSKNKTHPVGKKLPNGYGLYDTLGNVWEWNSTIIDGSLRGLRGGSWDDFAQDCRVAGRVGGDPSARSVFCGFRLARTECNTNLLKLKKLLR